MQESMISFEGYLEIVDISDKDFIRFPQNAS